MLAARYAKPPAKVAATVSANCLLTQADEAIVAMTTAYCCVLATSPGHIPRDSRCAFMKSGAPM